MTFNNKKEITESIPVSPLDIPSDNLGKSSLSNLAREGSGLPPQL